jgi:hypothetical protein
MSEFLMLLIILCQKIASSYERTIVILKDHCNRIHRPEQGNGTQIPTVEAIMVAAREVDHSLTLREYVVEMEEEPAVFGGVIQLHLKKITALLVKMKAILRASNWSSHIEILELVGNQVNELLRACNNCAN